jgi:segregation and condensation protein B
MSRMRQKRKARARAGEAEARVESQAANDEVVAEASEDAADPGEPELEAGSGEPGDPVEAEADADADPEADADADPEADADPDLQAGAEGGEASEEGSGGDGPDELIGDRLVNVIESMLFASEKPLTVQRIKQLTKLKDGDAIKAALDELVEQYAGRGIVLHDVAGGYQFRTQPRNSAWVQQLVAGRPVRLTRAQLETLAIVAYRQPITKPEIDEIRGVDAGGTLHLLLDRQLVRVLGKKEEPGRPLLYGTTRDFLEFFNLSDLRELPTLREYHELSEDSRRLVEEKLGADAAAAADAGDGDGAGEPTSEPDGEPAAVDAGEAPESEPTASV